MLSDEKIVTFLNEQVVPVWESVRPVPKVTIDFGDGKKITRTLAGNTVIYFCSTNGTVVDAFPGVYTPADFLPEAIEAINAVQDFEKEGMSAFTKYHEARVKERASDELRRITMSKAFVESPLLKAMGRGVESITPFETDSALNNLDPYLEDISKKAATAVELRKEYAKEPYDKLTPEQRGNLIVQLDSTQNIRVVRPATHLFLLKLGKPKSSAALRDIVYKTILHIPLDDPYLGLADVLLPGTPGGK